jgi:hypothetical protein
LSSIPIKEENSEEQLSPTLASEQDHNHNHNHNHNRNRNHWSVLSEPPLNEQNIPFLNGPRLANSNSGYLDIID